MIPLAPRAGVGKDAPVRRSPRRAASAIVVLLALAGAACDQADGTDAPRTGATVREDATTTSTTAAAIDITVRPEVITIAYADAVMAELDRILTEAVAAMVAEGVPNREFYDKLNAVYDEPAFDSKQSVYGELVADGVEEFRDPPGLVVTKAERVIRGDPHCVVLAVDRDFSAFLVSPRSDASNKGFVALAAKDASGDPAGHNRTPWSMVLDGDTADGSEPVAPC